MRDTVEIVVGQRPVEQVTFVNPSAGLNSTMVLKSDRVRNRGTLSDAFVWLSVDYSAPRDVELVDGVEVESELIPVDVEPLVLRVVEGGVAFEDRHHAGLVVVRQGCGDLP